MAFRAALDAICCWRSPPKASAGPHLRSSATKTIIVGGGASGLCTAYNLAKRCRAKEQNHCVIVIDKLDDIFAAASRYNSGIISYHWCSGDLRDFARYTYACYEDIAEQDDSFRKTTDYGDQSNFRLCRGSVESIARGPEWLNVPTAWHLEPDPVDGRAAIVNPQGLGLWLLRQCQIYGVKIYNHTEILSVHTSRSGIVEGVQVSRYGRVRDISCHNLVLAAGAWTPRLYKKLFPSSDIKFYQTTNSGNWVIVKSPAKPLIQNRCEVIFDEVVGHQLEFVGRNDGTIWISGLNNTVKCLGEVKGSEKPDEDAIIRLIEYARRFLLASESGSLGVVATGRTYRPTIDRELPIVTRVDPRKLCSKPSDGKHPVANTHGPAGGVFVCSGHGTSGIALAMGSGKLMSQIIMGDQTDYDVLKLGLPG